MNPAPVASTSPMWPFVIWGLLFFVIGAAILIWPHRLIRAYVAVLKPMRRLFFRNVIDWEIGLLQGRVAPILVRLFGLFVILAGGSIFFYRFNA